jgi:hypothetical protein
LFFQQRNYVVPPFKKEKSRSFAVPQYLSNRFNPSNVKWQFP